MLNNTSKAAQQICEAIEKNTYKNLNWNIINKNEIDSTVIVKDDPIAFHGKISPPCIMQLLRIDLIL